MISVPQKIRPRLPLGWGTRRFRGRPAQAGGPLDRTKAPRIDGPRGSAGGRWIAPSESKGRRRIISVIAGKGVAYNFGYFAGVIR
eukprot:2528207-Pyramimonas_sp.AAC.1